MRGNSSHDSWSYLGWANGRLSYHLWRCTKPHGLASGAVQASHSFSGSTFAQQRGLVAQKNVSAPRGIILKGVSL